MTTCEECGREIVALRDDENGATVWLHNAAMWDKSTQWGQHVPRPAPREEGHR